MSNNRTNIYSTYRGYGLSIFLLALMLCGGHANAWWNKEWTLRKQITIDPKAAGIGEATGPAVVLLRLHDGVFQFAAAKNDGADIRFVAADDKTLLPYHIEKFDALFNEGFVWVKVPDVKPGEPLTFWLYYGNEGQNVAKADDAKSTYQPEAVLVYHFSETGVPANDFTMNSNNARNAGTPVPGALIGGGLKFGGQSTVGIPASPLLEWSGGGAMTWSAWVKPAALAPGQVIFSRRDGAEALLIGLDNGVPFVEVTGGGGTQRTAAATPITAAAWHHLAVVANGSQITLYVDGESYSGLTVGLPVLKSAALLGGDGDAAATTANPGTGFAGELDELEISKVARPASFIKLAATAQGGEKADKIVSLGQDEGGSTSWLSGNGTFAVLVNSLTVDGWIVICILIVMAAISWAVMISKARYLNGISRGNAIFLKEWRHISADLTQLDHSDEGSSASLGGRVDKKAQRDMRHASVYRIYKIGAEEIRQRLVANPQGEGSPVLSSRAIQAIRASLDGGLVRETQKINSLMVFLTIAISGGPFLGLLGTVVGVMITFAAIAAAGDVNVNAIAPGIAAALLATVAGLAVAIPSLFGYNYLISRVKEATADMHVFIDEFVTRMAEFYGGPGAV